MGELDRPRFGQDGETPDLQDASYQDVIVPEIAGHQGGPTTLLKAGEDQPAGVNTDGGSLLTRTSIIQGRSSSD